MKQLAKTELATILIIFFMCATNALLDVILVNNNQRIPTILFFNFICFISYAMLYLTTKYLIRILHFYDYKAKANELKITDEST